MAAGPGIPPNCTGCDYAASDLHGADFTSVAYFGVDFSGSNLRNARFDRAVLEGIDFSRSDLRGASFRGSKLCWYNRGNADDGRIACPDFQGAKVQGADFRGSLICGEKNDCRPVDAATLQTNSRSTLSGALLP